MQDWTPPVPQVSVPEPPKMRKIQINERNLPESTIRQETKPEKCRKPPESFKRKPLKPSYQQFRLKKFDAEPITTKVQRCPCFSMLISCGAKASYGVSLIVFFSETVILRRTRRRLISFPQTKHANLPPGPVLDLKGGKFRQKGANCR
jgi:hypothetical protein